MLVLSRNLGEQIVIADGLITVTVVEHKGGKVRIGIDAPKEIAVHRKEVWDQIQANRRLAQEEEARRNNPGD